MFERLSERGRRIADASARRAALRIAERIEAELPAGIDAKAEEPGVRLSGRGLHKRWVLDSRLRWLIGGALR